MNHPANPVAEPALLDLPTEEDDDYEPIDEDEDDENELTHA